MFRRLFNYKRTGGVRANLKISDFVGNAYVIPAASKDHVCSRRLRAHPLKPDQDNAAISTDLSADRRLILKIALIHIKFKRTKTSFTYEKKETCFFT